MDIAKSPGVFIGVQNAPKAREQITDTVKTDLGASKAVDAVPEVAKPKLTFKSQTVRTASTEAASEENSDSPVDPRALEKLQKSFQPAELESDFQVDHKTQELIFRVLDKDSGEVVKQYPEESRLKLRAYLEEVEKNQLPTRSRSV